MDTLKGLWAKVPGSWKDRLYGAGATAAGVYGGPAAKDLAETLITCLRAHYGL